MNEITKAALLGNGHRPAPASQATHIEQSRAIAQVQGALIVAMQNPRDEIGARARMENACQVQALAEHAFFRYSRGGSQITGPSIHLACELARCWGNVDYGITELRRDDVAGVSEMQAYAWDLEVNNRVTNSFIVPHKRDKKGGAEVLTDMRDIYENNANAAARRLRECIFRILPKAFVEEAKTVAGKTLEDGGGEPIEVRRERLLEAFAGINVNRKQIERKIGRAADKLTAYDIGVLRVVYKSIRQGEVAVADEFPDDTAGTVTTALKVPAAAEPVAAHTAAAEPATPPAQPATEGQLEIPAALDRKRRAADATEPAFAGRVREIIASYRGATTDADLAAAAKAAQPHIDALPRTEDGDRARQEIGAAFAERRKALAAKAGGDLLGAEAR